MNNESKVLFITGAGSGIGLLTVRRALAEGWKVAAADVNAASLDQLGSGPNLLKLPLDVTDPVAVDAAVDQTENTLGPIYRLVNAAAIMPLGLLTAQKRETIHRIMAINYGGLVNITAAVLPKLLARQRGEFVSYASMAGHWPIVYMGAYNASKHAVVAFTEVLHHENRGRGVKIVCVCPPAVATPLLQQAKDTSWPKMLDQLPPITAEQVLDSVEQALQRDQLWVLPGPFTRIAWWLRRFLPGLLWWRVHAVEGI